MTRGRVASLVGVVGELLITAGVVLGLFVAYELWWTGRETAQAQDTLQDELAEQFDDPVLTSPGATPAPTTTVPAPPPGDALGLLHIPSFGADWEWAVVEGVRRNDLKKGPGHYPDTALPGEIGNFAVAGHRTTYGSPFANIDDLDAGDRIIVQTTAGWFTYAVDESEIVAPSRGDVVAPVPERPGVEPTEARITLTTCHPRYSAARRLIVYGTLVESRTPDQGPPADLA